MSNGIIRGGATASAMLTDEDAADTIQPEMKPNTEKNVTTGLM